METNKPIFFEMVKSGNGSYGLFLDTIKKNHSYLDFRKPPCRNINWLIYETASRNLIGCIGVRSSTFNLQPRTDFIKSHNIKRINPLKNVANTFGFQHIQPHLKKLE